MGLLRDDLEFSSSKYSFQVIRSEHSSIGGLTWIDHDRSGYTPSRELSRKLRQATTTRQMVAQELAREIFAMARWPIRVCLGNQE
jgi:hypothetical protein